MGDLSTRDDDFFLSVILSLGLCPEVFCWGAGLVFFVPGYFVPGR